MILDPTGTFEVTAQSLYQGLPVKVYHVPWFDLRYLRSCAYGAGGSIEPVEGIPAAYWYLESPRGLEPRPHAVLWLPSTLPKAARQEAAKVAWSLRALATVGD